MKGEKPALVCLAPAMGQSGFDTAQVKSNGNCFFGAINNLQHLSRFGICDGESKLISRRHGVSPKEKGGETLILAEKVFRQRVELNIGSVVELPFSRCT